VLKTDLKNLQDKNLKMSSLKNKRQADGRMLTWLLIFMAVIFMGIGISRGEMAEVLLKSTNICLECIGIG